MAWIDPDETAAPIACQGTLVYLTPTVTPYNVANAAKTCWRLLAWLVGRVGARRVSSDVVWRL